jgi:hypothetical protein
MTVVAGSLLATQELMEDCCCRILVGNPGADGGLLLQDPCWHPGADGGLLLQDPCWQPRS